MYIKNKVILQITKPDLCLIYEQQLIRFKNTGSCSSQKDNFDTEDYY